MKKLLDLFKYAIILGLSGLLMWYALKGINFQLLQAQLIKTNFFWLGISLMLALAGFLSRAYRWKMQLEPLDSKITFKDTYHATMIGYLANLVLPRMGEVFRCSIIKRNSTIPVQASFGTVITERLIDMVLLLAIMGITFLVEFNRISAFFLSLLSDKYQSFEEHKSLIYLIIGIGIIGLITLIVILVFFLNRLRENRFFLKMVGLIKGLLAGVFSVSKLNNKWGFLGHTLFIWLTYYLTSYLAFFVLPDTADLTPLAALTILVTGSIGMSVPVQGGIGAFHIMVTNTLVLYGLSKESGLAFALITHTSQTLLVVVLGGISFILSLSKRKQLAAQSAITTLPHENSPG